MKPKMTITKRWGDIPCSHRQHKHDGHCAFSHGHNWAFELEFTSDLLDANGFVVDFGKLTRIKEWLNDTFDHSHLFNEDDAKGLAMFEAFPEMFKVRVVPDASAEGLATYVYEHLSRLLEGAYPEDVGMRGLRIVRVTVEEDSKNKATLVIA